MPEDSLSDSVGPNVESTASGRYSVSHPRSSSYATLQVLMGDTAFPDLRSAPLRDKGLSLA